MITAMAIALVAPLFIQQDTQFTPLKREVVNEIEDPKAKTIVDSMRKAYADCKTYTDTGIVTMDDSSVEFSTWFKRPGQLLIKFSGKNYVRHGEFVLWISGERKKIQYLSQDQRSVEDDTWPTDTWSEDVHEHRSGWTLDIAAGAFSGISMGATSTVPQMLFPTEIGGPSFGDLKDLVYQGTEDDRGVRCDVLYSEKEGEKIWIDKQSHLLRHTYEDSSFLGEKFVTDTLYSPQVDVPISDASLTFEPPK